MASLWATNDIITAAKLNKSFNSGLDADKGVPSVVGEVYLATDTKIVYYSTDGTSWDKDLNKTDKEMLIQMISQVHPTLQALAAMDETTYSNIEKSGNNYQLVTGLDEYATGDMSGWDVSNTTIFYAKITVGAIGGSVTELKMNIKTAGGNGRMAIYSDNSGVPNALLVESSSQALNTGWNTFTITSTTLSANTSYWLAAQRSNDTYYYKPVASGVAKYQTQAYGAFPATATPVNHTYELNLSVSGAAVTGNIKSNAITADSAVLSFFKHLKGKYSNGGSTYATPVQVEIYGNADSYAGVLNATTKFTISPTDPRIILKRDALDTITASSNGQTVWNMTVAGGMPALPNHGTILATQIGVASVLCVEKSILGDWTDTAILEENVDYVVDYSTRTATKITLTSGTGIVSSQSKLRISWIADVMKIDGATNNTALKLKIYLNRTDAGETSPSIQPIDLGTGKYVEMLYGT